MNDFKLDNHPKIKPGFTVPDNYFENFRDHMMTQIQSEPKIIEINRDRKSWIYAAAAVLLLALAIPALNTFIPDREHADVVAIDDYFTYHTDIPEEQIVELLDMEDIDNIKIDYELEDAQIEEALISGQIENYILD